MPGATSSIPLRLEPESATQKGWVAAWWGCPLDGKKATWCFQQSLGSSACLEVVSSPATLTGHIFLLFLNRCSSPWSSKERARQPPVINSDTSLPSFQGLVRARGLWLRRFTPPRQGLTSSRRHYCLRTSCQSVRTCRNGFEVDCSAHGEGDAVFIE